LYRSVNLLQNDLHRRVGCRAVTEPISPQGLEGLRRSFALANKAKRWGQAAALAVLVVAVAGLVFYMVNQSRHEQQRLAALRQELADAKFDRDVLQRILASCTAPCPADVSGEVQRRLRVIAAEEADYQAAASDAAKLRAVAADCKACLVRAQALARAEQLDKQQQEAEQQQRRLEQQLASAGSDRAALDRFLADCGTTCPGELRAQAQARINTIETAVLRECHRQAAHPLDATHEAGIIGIDFDRIDAAQAVPACRAAFAIRPDDAQLAFQLGRAIQKVGGADAEIEAAQLYRKAAENGSAAAMNSLGFMYDKGTGVQEDEAEAVRWYRKAADAGNALGMNNVGLMYRNGRGVGKDEAEASGWFRKAADAYASDMVAIDKRFHELIAAGNYSFALDEAQRLEADYRARLGIAHPSYAYALSWLGLVAEKQRKYAEAEALYRRALATRETALGASHPDVARSLGELICVAQAQGKYMEATRLRQRARAIGDKAPDERCESQARRAPPGADVAR
jgi:TPR repeat protein